MKYEITIKVDGQELLDFRRIVSLIEVLNLKKNDVLFVNGLKATVLPDGFTRLSSPTPAITENKKLNPR